MRRRLSILAAAVAVALLMAACGGSDAVTPPDSSSQTTAVGDSERGRQIWLDGGGVLSVGCAGCHSIDGTEDSNPRANAPSWLGISERAGSTVSGLSAEMYLRESILDPRAYVLEGYTSQMAESYELLLSEDDVNALIAFLLTL